MPKISGWKRKQTKDGWKQRGTDRHIWLYPHKTWEINKTTGNVQNYHTTHWTVRSYNEKGKGLAKALEGKHFRTKSNARKFAINYMRRR